MEDIIEIEFIEEFIEEFKINFSDIYNMYKDEMLSDDDIYEIVSDDSIRHLFRRND